MNVYLDFETYYDKEYSLRKMATSTYVRHPNFQFMGYGLFIPDRMSEVVYVEPDQPQFHPLLQSIDWSQADLVCHNTKFDGFILQHHMGIAPRRYVDTLTMAGAVLGTTVGSLSLDNLGQHLNLTEKKQQGVLAQMAGVRFEQMTPAQRHMMQSYGKQDVVVMHLLHHFLVEMGDAFSLDGRTQEDWIMDMVTRMFCEPVLELDDALLEKIHADEVAAAERAVAESGLTRTELRSTHKFAAHLKELGVEVEYKQSFSPSAVKQLKQGGDPTYVPALAKTDDFFIELLDHPDDQVRTCAEARQAVNSSITRTRSRSYADASGYGPWCVDLKYSGARVTHRFSGASGGGGNPQNLGRGSPLRDAIIAPEGKVLVVADLSAIELRTSAVISGQWDLVERLRAYDLDPAGQKDAYVQFAEGHVFRRELSTDKDQYKVERTTGKVSILSCGYGSGGATFRSMLRAMSGGEIVVDINRADELVKIYRGAHPEYVSTWKWLDEFMLARMANPNAQPEGWEQLRPWLPIWVDYRRQKIRSHSGLTLSYPNLRYENRYNPFRDKNEWQYVYDDKTKSGEAFVYGSKCLGNLSQFMAREVIMYQSGIINASYPVKLSVHDENACVVWEQDGQQCLDFMLGVMTTPLPWWPDLPLAAEGSVARRYGEAK